LESVNLSFWMGVDSFTLLQSGYLWVEYEPPPDEALIRDDCKNGFMSFLAIPSNLLKPKPFPAPVKLALETLIDGINAGCLNPSTDLSKIPIKLDKKYLSPKYALNLDLIQIPRKNLSEFSKSLSVRPSFLESQAKINREKGLLDGISASYKKRFSDASSIVNCAIFNGEISASNVTKKAIVSLLYSNGIKESEKSKLIKNLWELLPNNMKNKGGRPQNQ